MFSIGISILIEMPIIYARLKDKKKWVPINSAPWMIGDDFYYYSFLNLYHKKILKIFYKKYHDISIRSIPISIKFQVTGIFFNILPYHLGWILEDKRLGVLFVKIWNRIFLFLSIYYFMFSVFYLMELTLNIQEYFTASLLFFTLYPGPLSLSRNGLLWNVFNEKHLFDSAQVNDLTRGMHSETTVPLLFIAVASLLLTVEMQSILIVILVFSIALYYQYFPAFIVFSLLSLSILFYNNLYFTTLITSIFLFAMTVNYIYKLGKCEVSTELIAHDDGGRLFIVSKRKIVEFLILITVIYWIYYYYSDFSLLILLSISSLFFATNFLFKHQLSRFWDRAATSIVQLTVIALLIKEVSEYDSNYLNFMFLFFLSVMVVYFTRNAFFLWKKSSTKVSNKIYNKDFMSNIFEDIDFNTIYITDIVELPNYIDLYTNNRPILLNYMLQEKGYKGHLLDVCVNYKYMGYKLDQLIKILTTPSGEWRKLGARENIPNGYHYYHELQYISTCYLFNHQIVIDKMYIDNKWTDEYISLLKNIWESVDVNGKNNFKIIRGGVNVNHS